MHRLATALWPAVLQTPVEARILLLEASAVKLYRIFVRISVAFAAESSADMSPVDQNSIPHFPRFLRHSGSRKLRWVGCLDILF